jgi:hypothetical protein
MEQRSLRLGDLVDDYCPRERRVTNHAIVALVGDSVRQTRCTTCETEHEYKGARMPRKKPKNGESHDLAGGVLVVPKPAASSGPPPASAEPADAAGAAPAEPDPASDSPAPAIEDAQADDETMPDGWLAHRPLIRASLPRTENDVPPPRPIPEFTMHQRQGRGFGGRGFHRGFSGHGGGRVPPPGRDGNEPDGNRAPGPGGPGGKSRHRRRHRRPR